MRSPARLEARGGTMVRDLDVAPDAPGADRKGSGQDGLEERLCGVLGRLDPKLPSEALHHTFRRRIRPEGATLGTAAA